MDRQIRCGICDLTFQHDIHLARHLQSKGHERAALLASAPCPAHGHVDVGRCRGGAAPAGAENVLSDDGTTLELQGMPTPEEGEPGPHPRSAKEVPGSRKSHRPHRNPILSRGPGRAEPDRFQGDCREELPETEADTDTRRRTGATTDLFRLIVHPLSMNQVGPYPMPLSPKAEPEHQP